MDDLRDSFKTDALPIDFLHATPGDIEATDDRTFVRQMRLIKVGDARIRWARIDFYRAYSQRSKWLSDNLLALQQLTDYDEILEEEWKRARDRLAEMTVEGETPELVEKCGLTLFDHCYDNCRSIRPNCTERYVGRGSYHMLADQKTVGWHRDYMRLLDAKAAQGKS